MEPFTFQAAAVEPGHVDLRSRFVYEDKPGRVCLGLIVPPILPFYSDVLPVLFRGP